MTVNQRVSGSSPEGGASQSSTYRVKFVGAFLFAPKFAPQLLVKVSFHYFKVLSFLKIQNMEMQPTICILHLRVVMIKWFHVRWFNGHKKTVILLYNGYE